MSVHDNLMFMKHIYVDMNIDVIIVRLRFVQQEWGVRIREGRVDQRRSKDVVCIVYFKKKHVRFSSDTTRLVIKCPVLHAFI
jgi:hypothetical protein